MGAVEARAEESAEHVGAHNKEAYVGAALGRAHRHEGGATKSPFRRRRESRQDRAVSHEELKRRAVEARRAENKFKEEHHSATPRKGETLEHNRRMGGWDSEKSIRKYREMQRVTMRADDLSVQRSRRERAREQSEAQRKPAPAATAQQAKRRQEQEHKQARPSKQKEFTPKQRRLVDEAEHWREMRRKDDDKQAYRDRQRDAERKLKRSSEAAFNRYRSERTAYHFDE